jgi:hypothetical protein
MLEGEMKLNYLLDNDKQIEDCPASATGKQKHTWVATSHIQAMRGNNVCVRFICKRCKRLHDEFMPTDKYRLHERAIESNKFMEY